MTDQQNQTQFSFEEPLFERPPQLEEPAVAALPWYRRKLILIVLGVVGLLLLIIILAVLSRPMSQLTPDQFDVLSTPTPAPRDAIQLKIEALQTELQAADPTKQELPFPPVDMELELTPAGTAR